MQEKEITQKYYCTNYGQIIDRSDYCIYYGSQSDKIVSYRNNADI